MLLRGSPLYQVIPWSSLRMQKTPSSSIVPCPQTTSLPLPGSYRFYEQNTDTTQMDFTFLHQENRESHNELNAFFLLISLLFSHLDSKSWSWCKGLDPELKWEVSGFTPAQAIILALYHHDAGSAALVEVEAQGVDQKNHILLMVHHHRAQVQTIRTCNIVNNKWARGPSGSCRDKTNCF